MAKRKPRLYLDMPFSEALERFAGVDPRHVEANIKKSKQKKPPRARKTKVAVSAEDQANVVRLRDRRKPHHN